ncbi:hypothetical protein rsdtw13_03560 [Clostridium sp. TW13]|uniref:Uncharacterized protein n=1 Tax=Inconstantimicrobium mannanitabidum TaxID=1604901 RepID=A0ACB5R7W3_9CLOT|nr:hypothetical protein rsdtw13_03560 [Clostridium sp. TW13]
MLPDPQKLLLLLFLEFEKPPDLKPLEDEPLDLLELPEKLPDLNPLEEDFELELPKELDLNPLDDDLELPLAYATEGLPVFPKIFGISIEKQEVKNIKVSISVNTKRFLLNLILHTP